LRLDKEQENYYEKWSATKKGVLSITR